MGVPEYAAGDGVVDVVRGGYSGGYGNNVIISHAGGIKTLYGHMSVIYVSAGQTVSKGEVIGLMGSTGRSTGPHLHFEVRVGGSKVNPLSYIR
jgi:murein DD-endopeptidase MepM/ murein hydrolase activator NlpD